VQVMTILHVHARSGALVPPLISHESRLLALRAVSPCAQSVPRTRRQVSCRFARLFLQGLKFTRVAGSSDKDICCCTASAAHMHGSPSQGLLLTQGGFIMIMTGHHLSQHPNL
jgi:hypothetical protein